MSWWTKTRDKLVKYNPITAPAQLVAKGVFQGIRRVTGSEKFAASIVSGGDPFRLFGGFDPKYFKARNPTTFRSGIQAGRITSVAVSSIFVGGALAAGGGAATGGGTAGTIAAGAGAIAKGAGAVAIKGAGAAAVAGVVKFIGKPFRGSAGPPGAGPSGPGEPRSGDGRYIGDGSGDIGGGGGFGGGGGGFGGGFDGGDMGRGGLLSGSKLPYLLIGIVLLGAILLTRGGK